MGSLWSGHRCLSRVDDVASREPAWSREGDTARECAERRRSVENTVIRVMATEDTLDGGLPRLLQAYCQAEGWDFGDVWWMDGAAGVFVCQGVWRDPALRLDELERVTRRTCIPLGQGLPGAVAEAEGLVRIPRISQESKCSRATTAVLAGMICAMGYPIHLGGKLAGVLTFFGRGPIRDEAGGGEVLSTFSAHVGQFVSRKRAQEELVRFVGLSPNVLYALRVTPAGPVPVWRSGNVAALTGFEASETLAPGWWRDRLHPEDRTRVLESMLQAQGPEPVLVEYRFKHRNGTYRWLADSHRVVRDAFGFPVEVFGSWCDVTERKELENQLLQAQKVEDQEALRLALEISLVRLGYRPVSAENAAGALELFRAEPDAFALVLTDQNMPGMTGLELAREILRMRPDVPVLLSSGSVSPDFEATAGAEGLRGILPKPTSLRRLSEVLAEVLSTGCVSGGDGPG